MSPDESHAFRSTWPASAPSLVRPCGAPCTRRRSSADVFAAHGRDAGQFGYRRADRGREGTGLRDAAARLRRSSLPSRPRADSPRPASPSATPSTRGAPHGLRCSCTSGATVSPPSAQSSSTSAPSGSGPIRSPSRPSPRQLLWTGRLTPPRSSALTSRLRCCKSATGASRTRPW